MFLAVCSALALVVGFTEKHFFRPYCEVQAAVVFDEKHKPFAEMDQYRIGELSRKEQCSREMIVRMYYNQRAMMTEAQERRAMDEMAKDTTFRKLISNQ